MQLKPAHKKQIILLYCIIFYLLMFYKAWSGLLLFQVQPHLYNSRFDFTTWLLMSTGIHTWLLDNKQGWLLFDILFYSMPLAYIIVQNFLQKAGLAVALLMIIVNWIYIQCYTLFPTNSIESYTAWLLFPFLFATVQLRSFYLVLHGLRYYFLFFFASAGAWKIIQSSVFNIAQLQAVLLYQHASYLVTSPQDWYSTLVLWLINHPFVGYCIFLTGTLLELSFVTGFFTKKYDKLLIVLFLLFLVFDALLMRIHYWEVSAFIITLWYSKHQMPEKRAS